jgi:hypothetical protein
VARLTDQTDDADREAWLSFYEASKAEQAENHAFRTKFEKYLDLQSDDGLVRAKQQRQVLSWLHTPNYRTRHESLQSQATADTGSWFVNKSIIQEFFASKSQSVVWVYGALG